MGCEQRGRFISVLCTVLCSVQEEEDSCFACPIAGVEDVSLIGLPDR